MIFFLFFTSLALAGFDLTKEDFALFKEFEVEFSKKYQTPTERLHRFSMFKAKLAEIRRLNSQRVHSYDAVFCINYMADMTPEEIGIVPHKYISQPNGANESLKGVNSYNKLPDLPPGNSLPASLSYCGPYVNSNTDHPKVDLCATQVNQNSCGCCYAAALANEAQIIYANLSYYKNNKNAEKVERLLFTPQRWLDVVSGPHTKRCCGGNSGLTIEKLPTYSLQKDYSFYDGEQNYGNNPPCTARGDQNPKVPILLKMKSFITWTTAEATTHAEKVTAIKKIIHHYGPVLVPVKASGTGFTEYSSGIFTFPTKDVNGYPVCQSNNVQTDHQVILVGYGKDSASGKEYFIGRNTWYTGWGENNNFIKISIDIFCGIGEMIGEYTLPQNYIFYVGSCKMDNNCKSCDTNTLLCSECKEGSTMDKRGVCVVPGQYGPEITCLDGCSKCTTETTCDVCSVGKVLRNDKKACLDKCPDGQYADAASNNLCTVCSTPNCAKCDGSNVCKECNSGYEKTSKNTCELEAPDCGDGKYGTPGNCKDCISGCKKCTDGVKCELCDGTGKLQEDKKRCFTTCPDGTYASGIYCKKCTTKNCAKCNDKNICTKCTVGFDLTVQTSMCESKTGECGEGQFGTAGNCQDCKIDGCKKCSNGETCDECSGSLFLETDKTECLISCSEGSFSDNQICYECSENCEKCQRLEVCEKCSDEAKINFEGKCYAVCPDGYYQEKDGCTQCKESYKTPCSDAECEKCTSKSGAGKSLVLAFCVLLLFFL